jgi:hypothetical protein
VGELTRWKGTKPSKTLNINPPRYATDPDELPFQEGRPLDSSNEEGGLVKPKARNFPPEQEIFMVRIVEIQLADKEDSGHLQLDDYYIDNDYISDTPGQDTDTTIPNYLIMFTTLRMSRR